MPFRSKQHERIEEVTHAIVRALEDAGASNQEAMAVCTTIMAHLISTTDAPAKSLERAIELLGLLTNDYLAEKKPVS